MPTDGGFVDRVSEALWQAQVQHMRSQEWFNFAADGYLLTDLEGVIHEANYAAAALLDSRKEYLLGKPLGLFVSRQCQRTFYEQLPQLAASGGVKHWEAQVGRAGGKPREVALTAAAISGEFGHSIKLRWMLHDVSRAHQVERAWHAEKILADSLLESAEILILLVDEPGAILRCNPYAATVSGIDASELCGQSWLRLLPESDRQTGRALMLEAAHSGSSRSGILDLAARGGPSRRVLWSARQLGPMLLLVGHDVTDLQEAQQHALQVERLAAIGQMAAGLAHESRNALQRGQACVALLALRLQDQPECLDLLRRIEKAQDDLHRLFDDVRTYASTPRLQRRWYNLSESWREAWSNLTGLAEQSSAELYEDVADANLFCETDGFYLRQVFRNLLENALASGATLVRLTVRSEPGTGDGEDVLCIRLRDNGSGIPPESRARLFEPFFTTKVRGTGLGLAICKRILEAHGGSIHVEEDAAPGTELILHLPRR